MFRGREDAARPTGAAEGEHDAFGPGCIGPAPRRRAGSTEPAAAEDYALHVPQGEAARHWMPATIGHVS